MEPLNRSKLRLLRGLRHRAVRRRRGLVVVEGLRAVEHALQADLPVAFVALTPDAARRPETAVLSERAREDGVDVYAIEPHHCAEICDTVTPAGLLALVSWAPPAATELDDIRTHLHDREITSVLALDAVTDPGNVGTLVRTAGAFAVGAVLFGRGTVDPMNPKVIRSSAGTILTLPGLFSGVELEALLDILPEDEWAVFRAEVSGGSDRPEQQDSRPWILLLGSEASGVRPELKRRGQALTIPQAGRVESLNVAVAGGILMYVLTQGQGP